MDHLATALDRMVAALDELAASSTDKTPLERDEVRDMARSERNDGGTWGGDCGGQRSAAEGEVVAPETSVALAALVVFAGTAVSPSLETTGVIT